MISKLMVLGASAMMFPALSHASGLGWSGTCRNSSLTVNVAPFDDDAQITITNGKQVLYDGVAIVSTFDKGAELIEFYDGRKMKLTVRRSETLPEGQGDLTLAGKSAKTLTCNLFYVDTN